MANTPDKQSNEAFECMIGVHLNDLEKPHKLSKWFKALPIFKQQYLRMITGSAEPESESAELKQTDISMCDELAAFAYKNNLIGAHLLRNFGKADFVNIVSAILSEQDEANMSTESEQISKHEWIWLILHYHQGVQHKNRSGSDTSGGSLKWYNDTWDRFEVYFEQNQEMLLNSGTTDNALDPEIDDIKEEQQQILSKSAHETVSNNSDTLSDHTQMYGLTPNIETVPSMSMNAADLSEVNGNERKLRIQNCCCRECCVVL